MDDYFQLLTRSTPLLIKGAMMTLQVFAASSLLSFILGAVFGILTCERLRVPFLSWALEGVCFVYRAIPFFVQLLIVYFVLPDLFNISLEPFPASVIALGMCSSGYVAQIVRSGLNAVAASQWEAAYVLGYSKIGMLRSILLPQLMRSHLPALNNELDSLLKSTAIVSSIGMLELTRIGMNIVSREMEPVAIYLTVAVFYLAMSSILNLISRTIERRLTYAKC